MSEIFSKKRIFSFKELDSTNKYAGKLSDPVPEGSIVTALYQTNGRGNGSNSWESSPAENLLFSVILYPEFLRADRQFYLSKIVSLAVADLVALNVSGVSIKWPNDIYVTNKKIAGILIENSINGEFIKESIVGIGINVNQEKFNSNAPNPISLCQLTGKTYDLSELLDLFSDILEFRYGLLKEGDFTLIDENYMDILYKKGVKSQYIAANEEKFEGTIIDIEKTGELIIEDVSGKQRRFMHKEVEYVIS